jgi:hypothetical protein
MPIKKRIVYMILGKKEPVHLEVISTEEEINKLVKLLETSYYFQYFNIIPLKEKE